MKYRHREGRSQEAAPRARAARRSEAREEDSEGGPGKALPKLLKLLRGEAYCPDAGQKNIVMERMMKDFLEHGKEMMDKMIKDISRVESKMDKMEERINELESFHLKK